MNSANIVVTRYLATTSKSGLFFSFLEITEKVITENYPHLESQENELQVSYPAPISFVTCNSWNLVPIYSRC